MQGKVSILVYKWQYKSYRLKLLLVLIKKMYVVVWLEIFGHNRKLI
jgi:hypothetical protein